MRSVALGGRSETRPVAVTNARGIMLTVEPQSSKKTHLAVVDKQIRVDTTQSFGVVECEQSLIELLYVVSALARTADGTPMILLQTHGTRFSQSRTALLVCLVLATTILAATVG